MPNKDYMEKKYLEKFLPSNWERLDERSQRAVSWEFGYMLEKDKERRILMKHFHPDNWMKLDENQKLEVCQTLENNLSIESGRPPYKIFKYSEADICGIARHRDKSIGLNFDYNSYTVLDTLVHESCHADQIDLVLHKKSAQTDGSAKDSYKNRLGRSGLNEKDVLVIHWEAFYYTDGRKNDKLYRMQFQEVEAVLETAKYLNKYSEYIEKNPMFDEFIHKINEEINLTYDSFKDENLVKEWFQDRRERFEKTDMKRFNKRERLQLKAIYFTNALEKCGFNLLEDLENWCKRGATKVKRMTLDELQGEQPGKQPGKSKRETEPGAEIHSSVFGSRFRRL